MPEPFPANALKARASDRASRRRGSHRFRAVFEAEFARRPDVGDEADQRTHAGSNAEAEADGIFGAHFRRATWRPLLGGTTGWKQRTPGL